MQDAVKRHAVWLLVWTIVSLVFQARLTEVADWVVGKVTASGLLADAIRGLIEHGSVQEGAMLGRITDFHYNFGRAHRSLANPYPRTPAMAACVADHIWSLEEIAGMMDVA